MSHILVAPELLRSLSSRLQHTAGDLRAICGRLGGVLSALDLEISQAAGVEAEWDGARRQAYALADQAESLARYLLGRAQAFEEADGAGSAAIGQVLGMFVPARYQWETWWQRILPVVSLPTQLLAGLLRLGHVILEIPPFVWPATVLAGLGGWIGTLAGKASLQPVPRGWEQPIDTAATDAVARKGQLSATILPKFEGLSNRPLGPQDAVYRLEPADPTQFDPNVGCVAYAKARRPDLTVTDAPIPGAADYIGYYERKGKTLRLTGTEPDLRQVVKPGYAVVWDRGNPALRGTAGYTWGHIAIVEEVYADHVKISQGGWPGRPHAELSRDELAALVLIL